jgi:hypothetical protein
MRSRAIPTLLLVLGLAGCPGGGGGIGDPCGDHGDCGSLLQCIASVCVPRCQRAPECGDGYSCDTAGLCHVASGQAGDKCTSEVDCAAGLSCQIDGGAVGGDGRLLASCTQQNPGRPAGSECAGDADCRNGTCALGHCVDLCMETRDCGGGNNCMQIPRVEAGGAMFQGCLPSRGSVTWSIPIPGPSADILFPVPDAAHSATLVFRVDDPAQKVGAQSIRSPNDVQLYERPCVPSTTPPVCTEQDAIDQYYSWPIRHLPEAAQSAIAIPSTPATPLEPGAYKINVSSFRPNGTAGSAIPHLTAVMKMDPGVLLDLHFYFLDLEDHPCEEKFGGNRLDAAAAKTATFFQSDFLGQLRTIFAGGDLALGTITYEDITTHPDLDGLAVADAGALLSLGAYDVGVNVFFVRTLSPVGLQAFGPNPGPAGLAGTRQSGVVIGVDTLCYQPWDKLARLTAHEIARYMGLFHNVELEVADNPTWRDLIDDSDDSPTNLMFFSERGGVELSTGQKTILMKSAVLR